MQFENQEESSNIDDQRGASGGHRGGGFGFGGGGFHLPGGRGGLGLGGILVLLVASYFLGINPLTLLSGTSGPVGGSYGGGSPASSNWSGDSETPLRQTAAEQALKSEVAKVLATTETCWRDLFQHHYGRRYEEPRLVLFRDGVRSACGAAQSSMGPFYCPGDQRVYLDLSFFDEMNRSLGAKGDFARAYVVAHEVGHHVQNLLGTSRKVQALHGRVSSTEYNKASVHLELQADYFAGVWAHYVQNRMRGKVTLDVGDYEEAIGAAHAVGDDTLQRRATGRIVPENFTHGTAAQRAKWFKLGFDTGDPLAHDPFQEEK